MKRSLLVFLILACFTMPDIAQTGYQPTEENLKNREWFQDAKYGMFLHWGVYSVMGGGGDMGIAEWIMDRKQIPIQAYENLPTILILQSLILLNGYLYVKNAGMKYITITVNITMDLPCLIQRSVTGILWNAQTMGKMF